LGIGDTALRFLTSTLDGGELKASRPGRFTPRERAQVPILQEAGWTPELSRRKGSFTEPTGNRTPAVQPVI